MKMTSKRMHLTKVSLFAGLAITLCGMSAHAGSQSWWWVGSNFGPAAPAPVINHPTASDGCPIEAPDGLSVAIASTRGEGGDLDIWAADRESVGDDWAEPQQLPDPINTDAAEFCPTPLGRSLYFVSTRPAACMGGNLYVARQGINGGWSTPQLLPCAPEGPNFDSGMFSPSIVKTRKGTYLFYSSFGDDGDHNIYVSIKGKNGQFGPGRVVHALSNIGDDDRMPNVRRLRNGMWEVVFSSNRATWGAHNTPAFGGQDVYRAVSPRLPFVWSKPKNLGPNVNTDADETRSSLSGDGKRLYFGRSGDVYVSERN